MIPRNRRRPHASHAVRMRVMTHVYGEPLLRYMLNVPLGHRLDPVLLDNGARSRASANLCQEPSEALLSLDALDRVAEQVLDFPPRQRHSAANLTRLQCGGALPEFSPLSDPLESAVASLASEWFAATLLPIHSYERLPLRARIAASIRSFGVGTPVADLLSLLAADDDIGGLVETSSQRADPSGWALAEGFVYWPDSGGIVQMAGILCSLVEAVLVRCALTADVDLAESATRVTARARALARGQSAHVDRLAYFPGVQLPTPGPLRIGQQVFITSPGELPLAPVTTRGGGLLVLLPYETRVVDRALPSVVEDADTWLDAARNKSRSEYRKAAPAHSRQELEIRLAWLLATRDRKDPITAPRAYSLDLNPLRGGSVGWRAPRDFRGSPDALTEAEVQRLLPELSRCRSLPQSLEVGAGRLVDAAGERERPQDVLIDSVIAWESFLGADREIIDRLSTSTAWLLHPGDQVAREASYRDAKRLYGIRSRIAHGAANRAGFDLHEAARDALKLGIRVLDAILEREDLSALSKSHDRSDQLILGLTSKQPEGLGA